jgi:hypothetical protein
VPCWAGPAFDSSRGSEPPNPASRGGSELLAGLGMIPMADPAVRKARRDSALTSSPRGVPPHTLRPEEHLSLGHVPGVVHPPALLGKRRRPAELGGSTGRQMRHHRQGRTAQAAVISA